MSSVARPQDLPPPGGFSKIVYEKVPHKTFFNGKRIALATLISYAIGFTGIWMARKYHKRVNLELQSGTNAIEPFLMAERDRQVLRQLRINRDAEEDLMKNVEGWEVGTLFGTPIYNTIRENEWFDISGESYYAHADPKEVDYYVQYHLFV